MTLWWVERERDGKREIVVPASKDKSFCDVWMAAVHEWQPSAHYVLCSSKTGGERQVVDEYTPPKASEADGTVWWIERRDEDGWWKVEVSATDDYRYCWGFMDAVVRLRAEQSYAMFQSDGDGEPRMVRRYVGRDRRRGDSEASEPLATEGEWRTGEWKTNDGRECVILEVQEDGVLHWAVKTANGTWNLHCGLPCRAGHHPERPVREVVQRHKVDAGGVSCSIDDDGTTQVRWTIRGGKIVGVELVDGE